MSIKQVISDIITKELSTTDNFLVNVNSNQDETSIKFYIDGIQGVSIQVCSKLSRKISHIIDEEYPDEPAFRYEISSPGVDEPLVDQRQYPQHIGRDLIVEYGDELTAEGELISVNDTGITLEILVSKHKKSEQTILFEEIKQSIVKISFKRKKK